MESFLIQGFCDQFKFYKYTYILEKLLLINLSYRLVLACDAYLKQKSIYVDFRIKVFDIQIVITFSRINDVAAMSFAKRLQSFV